jgi:hypothetical protein
MMKYSLIAILALSSLSGCMMYEERNYQPGVYPVSRDEVIEMTRSGYSEGRIIGKIEANGVDRRASADDILALQNAGVSSRVMAGFTEAPVRQPQAAVETRTRYYRDWSADPGFTYGLGMLTGYLLFRHCR